MEKISGLNKLMDLQNLGPKLLTLKKNVSILCGAKIFFCVGP